MSIWQPIWTTIQQHTASGRLRAVRPRSPRDTIKRPIYLVPTLYEVIYTSYPASTEKDRYNSLQADLEVFLTGLPITDSYLCPIRPLQRRVWEIRSKVPKPSVRIFGLFASRDVFVGTNHQVRSALGGFNSLEWKQASRIARHEWKLLFHAEPLQDELDKLVTKVTYVRKRNRSN